MIHKKWMTTLLWVVGLAWADETDAEIVKYLDFYENLEILTDQNISNTEDFDALDMNDPSEKGDT